MQTLSDIVIQPHRIENNSVSMQILAKCFVEIKKSCAVMLQVMRQGIELSVDVAYREYYIPSPPRRALDLIESGIKVDKRYEGKNVFYSIGREERERLDNLEIKIRK